MQARRVPAPASIYQHRRRRLCTTQSVREESGEMSLPSKDLEELRDDVDKYERQVAQSSSREEALELAIRAAETSMRALSLVKDPNEKVKYSTRAQQLMRQAEQIKHSGEWRNSAPSIPAQPSLAKDKVRLLKEPVNSRKLPTKERILLLKASYLNGVRFPPWDGPPSDSEFVWKPGEALFTYVFSFYHSISPC